jgi:hypothetical protein
MISSQREKVGIAVVSEEDIAVGEILGAIVGKIHDGGSLGEILGAIVGKTLGEILGK